MSIVVTYNLMCEVCKKRIEVIPYLLQHTYSGVKIRDELGLPEGWSKIDEKHHVCSEECLAAHSTACKVHGDNYLYNTDSLFSW